MKHYSERTLKLGYNYQKNIWVCYNWESQDFDESHFKK